MRLKLDENLPTSAATRLSLVRLPDTEQWRVGDYLAAWFSTADADSWERCFVVATPTKVRVRRPPSP